MITALSTGRVNCVSNLFAELSFISQEGDASLGRSSRFVVEDGPFAVLAGRLGIKTNGTDISELRIDPRLAETYITLQNQPWGSEKAESNTAYQSCLAEFQRLPKDVEENVARLAEMRLVVLKMVLTGDGFSAYLQVGRELKDELAKRYNGDPAKMLEEIRSELETKVDNGQPLTVDRIEKRFKELCGSINEDFSSYSDLLLRIHHGLWHSNLEKAHEFAYRMDNLPIDPVIDEANPAKSRPNGLRSFSDKANLLTIVGQLFAFSNTIEAHPEQQLVKVLGEVSSKASSMVSLRMGSTVRDLDKDAAINN
jgi:hypothetical protein